MSLVSKLRFLGPRTEHRPAPGTPNLSGADPSLSFRQHHDTLVLVLEGTWRLPCGTPGIEPLRHAIARGAYRRIAFDCEGVHAWDSALVSFVTQVTKLGQDRQLPVDRDGLPPGVRRLLSLVQAAPSHSVSPERRASLTTRIGTAVLQRRSRYVDAVTFLGETVQALLRVLVGRGHLRARDFWFQVQLAGAQALPVVTLVSFLVGLILAFVGAVQLQRFGATIFVADLVGIAIVRDMAAIMTAIILAGRTGAAYAAEIGSMRVTEEVDALHILGISTVEFLVIPRVLALTMMIPLLSIFANVVGVLGGAVVAVGMLDIRPSIFQQQTIQALQLSHLFGGLAKATVYGALVAIAGCFEGLRCGRSAEAVGRASTAAVVDGIVLIIVASGLFAIAFYSLGIE